MKAGNSRLKGVDWDFIICCAVFIQSPLILLQHVLIDVFSMNASSTTMYRVILTAIPMLLAIIVSFNRRPRLFVFSYLSAVLLLLSSAVFFPQNLPFILYESTRFLLPVVLPSALCLACVKSLESSERALEAMSWVAAVLVLVYVAAYLGGIMMFRSYNMSFSYGCLLPMIALYYTKRPVAIFTSLIMFLAVVAIGSRGAAVVFAFYVLADAVISYKRGSIIVILVCISFLLLLPLFSSWLKDLGIYSRTLYLYSEGELISYDAGRGELYRSFSLEAIEHPLFGMGFYGDRYYTGGGYCHNVLLEICLNFGFFLGPIIIFFLLFKLSFLFVNESKENKRILLKYICFGLLPLMVSSSYLQSPFLSILIGMYCLVKKSGVSEPISE